MKRDLDIWFPNYKNNPGIVSKELRSQISRLTEHFQVSVGEGSFHGFEKYLLELELRNSEYEDYIIQLIRQKFGAFTDPDRLAEGDILLGRLHSPGKVGFGIFTDIGIRMVGQQNDALLPLYQLREDLELDELPTREIVKILGLVDGYPIPVEVTSIERDNKLKIDVKLAEIYIDQLLQWGEEEKERMLLTKTLQSNVIRQVKSKQLMPYIDDIVTVDPLTTIIVCNSRTNASGLLPKIGSGLNKVPIGIFHP